MMKNSIPKKVEIKEHVIGVTVVMLCTVLFALIGQPIFTAHADATKTCEKQKGTLKSDYGGTLICVISDPENPYSEGKTITSSETAKDAAENAAERKRLQDIVGCTALNWVVKFGECVWVKSMSWLGSWFLTLGGFILQFAGYLFNILVQHIIVGFGTTLQTLNLINGIHTGWEVLRDISNIVIIGMFVFIAISMILGIEKFGAKRMVANVLIVAVLINFSLLFSKIIIDASNFTAYQFYKGMGAESRNDGANVAGSFLAIIGIEDIWDTQPLVDKFGQSLRAQGNTTGNTTLAGIAALLFGIMGGALLLIAAGVLLYGCYLIAVRGILLIFLMIVSALAFASYLVPKLSGGSYGWGAWWKALINAAIFAPLLMVLLYVSLLILTPAAPASKETFGKIITNPKEIATGDNWTVLVLFIFGIGMLYVSLRVANSFSNQIAGFNFAGSALKMSAGIPIAIGSRLAGFLGRNTIGRSAIGREIDVKKQLAEAERELRRTSRSSPMYGDKLDKVVGLTRKADKYRALSESSFKATQTDLGKRLMKTLEVPGSIVGKDKKGPGEEIRKTAQDAAKQAAGIAKVSETEAAEVRKRAEETMRKERIANSEKNQKDKETAQANLEKEKEAAKERERTHAGETQGHRNDEESAKREQEKIRQETRADIRKLTDAATRRGANPEEIKVEVEKKKHEGQMRLNAEQERINKAREKAMALDDEILEPVRKAQAVVDAHNRYDAETEELAKAAGKKAVENLVEGARKAAEDVAVGITRSGAKNIIPRATLQRTENSPVTVATKDFLANRIGASESDKLLEDLAQRLQSRAPAQSKPPETPKMP